MKCGQLLENVNNFLKRKELIEMNIYSCENHIDQVLEDFIEKEEKFPLLKALQKKEMLSTICTQCEREATYVVANE